MDLSHIPENPYLLLTPGPLSTSKGVRAALLRDWCTWDDDYNAIVQDIRARLAALASGQAGYTAVLLQGSGSFAVEATIHCAIGPDDKLLALSNGAYGARLAEMARRLCKKLVVLESPETQPPDLTRLDETLAADPAITHVAMIHCETTTGLLNPVDKVGEIVKRHGRLFILDAMSSFAGIEMDQAEVGADFLISSANKCIQGVPGFAFVLAQREQMEKLKGRSASLCLDLYDQWHTMETQGGKWRYTSPTHVVRAFAQALLELDEEGGVAARAARYRQNHRTVVDGLRGLGFKTLLPDEYQSPIITTFLYPDAPDFTFKRFYLLLKEKGFVIYPGKVSQADTFRIGHIGHVFPADNQRLVQAVSECLFWRD